MARTRRPRRMSWVPLDTGVIQATPAQQAAEEPSPIFARSVFSSVRYATGAATSTPAATSDEAERLIHRDFASEYEDATVMRIVGELLTFPVESGLGTSFGRFDVGITMLSVAHYDAEGLVPLGTAPNPAGYDQADWIWHQSGWVEYTAEGAQTPLVRHVNNKSRRVIQARSIPAFVVNLQGDPTASVNVGFRGRMLLLKA